MAFEAAVAVFDACILYPFHLRNVLVQAAVDRLVEARWTDEIHDEWIRNLTARTPAVPIERLQSTRRLMNDALPTAIVSGYEKYVAEVNLPDQMIAMSSQPGSLLALPSFSPGTCATSLRRS